MEWNEIEVNGERTIKFSDKLSISPSDGAWQYNQRNHAGKDSLQQIGGIIKNGEWAWVARGCCLQVLSLRNSHTIATYEFADRQGYENCSIKCVEQLLPDNAENVLLAIILRRGSGVNGTLIALFSVEHSAVISCIEYELNVNCARFLGAQTCRGTLLLNFDGCLALGTDGGVVVLLNLNIRRLLRSYDLEQHDGNFVTCNIAQFNLSFTDIHRNFQQCQQDGLHFGLCMEVIENPCAIQSILPIDITLGLAIGLEDGRFVLYDLAELQIVHIGEPQIQQAEAPLMHMAYLEPPDDPRPCVYVWTLHDNGENLYASLHTIVYEKRLYDDNDVPYFETFQNSCVRLQLPLEATKSVSISCQAIMKSNSEEDSNCLCAISWYSVLESKNKLLLFDLNQWYKEEMPFILNWRKKPNFLAAFVLNSHCGLDVWVNGSTIAHFNSIQRFEEHFYPNSLSFDCSVLQANRLLGYKWEGAQNRIINMLRNSTASIFLDPEPYFSEILRTKLWPQFEEVHPTATFSKPAKYNILLSVALENNCYSLLRDCAKSWADGSFLGSYTQTTSLCLSTLTNWISKRATDVKKRCNDLCKGLFDYGGYPLDQREQKELVFITRQLKLLADLVKDITVLDKRIIPEKVYNTLQTKYKTLRMAADYQNVLLWLLNIGLLPEAPYSSKFDYISELVPYPYDELKEFYTKQRDFFAKNTENSITPKTGSCRLIYIDAFIEHECKGNILREYWLDHNGDNGVGLYPPISIESMLRVMLVPDVDFNSKCAILLYFFLDLHMAIDEQMYGHVIMSFIKFPSVFKLPASLIKTVQAFWNLDHGHFLPAVDEFVSPFNSNESYPQWSLELLIETLLTRNAHNLALRILEARPNFVSPVLKLKTLLANDLLSEAFHFTRTKEDDSLLEVFFTCCLRAGKFGVIRDFAFNDREEALVQQFLRRSKMRGAENLHFVYLLQKSKYIEAVSYMDELTKVRGQTRHTNNGPALNAAGGVAPNTTMDTPNLVLSAFNTTMTPVTQGLTDVYFRIKNRIKRKEVNNRSPMPLSCQLIKQDANNMLGGIYHSSALSAHFATYYWGESGEEKNDPREIDAQQLLNANNVPFLRKPQSDTYIWDVVRSNNVSYPQPYRPVEKRRRIATNVTSNEMSNSMDRDESIECQRITNQLNPKKRRRLLGKEIVEDLSQLMQKHKSDTILNAEDFSLNPVSKSPQVDILTQPPIKKIPEAVPGSKLLSTTTTEIHSILKTNTPEPPDRIAARRELNTIAEEEKNIRFHLPSESVRELVVNHSYPKILSTLPARVVEANKADDYVEHSMEIPAQMSTNVNEKSLNTLRRKTVTRTLSMDSNSSSESNNSKTASEENFYSPLSSQNASMVVMSAEMERETASGGSGSKYNFPSGPQPRKSLLRLSEELSENLIIPKPKSVQEESTTEAVTSVKTSATDEIIEKAITTTNSDFVTAYTSSKLINKNYSATSVAETITSTAKTDTNSFLAIESVSRIAGRDMAEFLPTVSSSRICETQSKFAKIAECVTVAGGITYSESSADVFKFPANVDNISSNNSGNPDGNAHALDTTLGMSSYEVTIMDVTHASEIVPTKSPEKSEAASPTPSLTKHETDDLQQTEEKIEEKSESSDPRSGALGDRTNTSYFEETTFADKGKMLDIEKESDDNCGSKVVSMTIINDDVNDKNSFDDNDNYTRDTNDYDDDATNGSEAKFSSMNDTDDSVVEFENVIVLSSSESSSLVIHDVEDYGDSDVEAMNMHESDENIIEESNDEDIADEVDMEDVDIYEDLDENYPVEEMKDIDHDDENSRNETLYLEVDHELQEEQLDNSANQQSAIIQPQQDVQDENELENDSVKTTLKEAIVVDIPVSEEIIDQCAPELVGSEVLTNSQTILELEQNAPPIAEAVQEDEEHHGEPISSMAEVSELLPAQLIQNETNATENVQVTNKQSPSVDEALDMDKCLRTVKEPENVAQTIADSVLTDSTEEVTNETEIVQLAIKEPENVAQTKADSVLPDSTEEVTNETEIVQLAIKEPENVAQTIADTVLTDSTEEVTNETEIVQLAVKQSSPVDKLKSMENQLKMVKAPENVAATSGKTILSDTSEDATNAIEIVHISVEQTSDVEKEKSMEKSVNAVKAAENSAPTTKEPVLADTTADAIIGTTSLISEDDEIRLHVDEEECETAVATKTQTTDEKKNNIQDKDKPDTTAIPSLKSPSEGEQDYSEPTHLEEEAEVERGMKNEKDEVSPSVDTTAKQEQSNIPIRKRSESISQTTTADAVVSPTLLTVKTSKPYSPDHLRDLKELPNFSSPIQRSMRGISVPPQTVAVWEADEERDNILIRTRLNRRASSVQPQTMQHQEREEEDGSDSAPNRETLRGRRAITLDKIKNTGTPVLDSPSTRTRLRLRLSSMDSDLDTSVASGGGSQGAPPKRSRHTSISSNVSEQQLRTPKRSRRNSISSQPRSSTPMVLRSHSAAGHDEHENDHDTDGASTYSSPNTTVVSKRHKKTHNEKQLNEEQESPKAGDDVASSSSTYSNARRLTRSQLAIMEKSAEITARTASRMASSLHTDSAVVGRRISKRRLSQQSKTNTNVDSDDAASISSHLSNVSNSKQRRRVTRNSLKERDDVDDDVRSVASSIVSERVTNRRSKDKNSPNTTLTVIPEDESEGVRERKKRGASKK